MRLVCKLCERKVVIYSGVNAPHESTAVVTRVCTGKPVTVCISCARKVCSHWAVRAGTSMRLSALPGGGSK